MMFGRSRTREWVRTCERCGNRWYVTAEDRKLRKPNGLQTMGLKMQSAGNRGKVIGGKKKAIIAEQRLARAQTVADRYDQVNRCGECGSVKFREELAD